MNILKTLKSYSIVIGIITKEKLKTMMFVRKFLCKVYVKYTSENLLRPACGSDTQKIVELQWLGGIKYFWVMLHIEV